MPVIRVEVPEGTSQESKRRIRDGVKQAVLDTLAPKETINVDPRDLYVLFRENPAENHYTGGEPLAPWVPASELGSS